MQQKKITFTQATLDHKDIIFNWLNEPHMLEFWDTTQDHKDDIINFMNGRKEQSDYCDGKYFYWIGLIDNEPFSMIMTIKEEAGEDRAPLKEDYISKTGNTYGMDFCIGNINYIGKGLAALTLKAFCDFFKLEIDSETNTFMIDPYDHNPRAKHVYSKAGFELVGEFTQNDKLAFLLVKKLY